MEDLIKALTVLKENCEKHENCWNCPCSDEDGMCIINEEVPNDWKITITTKALYKL